MSQHYLLPCACGQMHRVAPAQAGGQVTCGCGQSLSVPTLRGIRELQPAPETGPAKTAPGWSRIHGAIFALSLVAAAAGLCMVGYYVLFYSLASQYTTDETDAYIALEEEQSPIDQLTPLTALEEWNRQVLHGLGPQGMPPWIAARMSAARYLYWAKFGGCLLAAGALIAIATLFIGRGRKQLAL
jgi:hypothetical protein